MTKDHTLVFRVQRIRDGSRESMFADEPFEQAVFLFRPSALPRTSRVGYRASTAHAVAFSL